MDDKDDDGTKLSTPPPGVRTVGIPPATTTTANSNGKKKISTREMCRVLRDEFGIGHIMVEGGPETAKQFLMEGMVDRVILVKAPLTFKEPLPSDMSTATFENSGLKFVARDMLGVDTVEYWSKDGDWPKHPPTSWP